MLLSLCDDWYGRSRTITPEPRTFRRQHDPYWSKALNFLGGILVSPCFLASPILSKDRCKAEYRSEGRWLSIELAALRPRPRSG